MTPMTAEDIYGQPVASSNLFFRSDERRSRDALTLAHLPRQHYGNVLELGCGIGAIAWSLALRSDDYVGMDADPEVLDRARGMQMPYGGLRFVLGGLDEIPAGPFDLVLVSDLLATMTPVEISALAKRIDQVAPEADVVCVSEIAQGGDLGGSRAPALLAQALGWPLTATHVGRGFRIDVFAACDGPEAD